MSIRTEFDYKIEEDEIIRLFGYKDCEPSQEILDKIYSKLLLKTILVFSIHVTAKEPVENVRF